MSLLAHREEMHDVCMCSKEFSCKVTGLFGAKGPVYTQSFPLNFNSF